MTRKYTAYVLMLPVLLFFLVGFVAPVVIVSWYSLMTPRSFELTSDFTIANYVTAFSQGYGWPFIWSILLAALTTGICLVIAWPTAKILHRWAGKWATIISSLIALPIFISETVRLFGMSLFLMPGGGILAGSVKAVFGVSLGTILNTKLAVLVGLIYVYFPFVLFPVLLGVSQISQDRIDAARDLGANGWACFREIELPLAAPGVMIGSLLTFVLCIGANAEAAILGGQAVTTVTRAIEQRFSYAKDWPMGAALTMLVIAVTALLVFPVLSRIDLNKLIRR